MSDQGKANYTAVAAKIGGQHDYYDKLTPGIKAAYDAGADAVEQWLAAAHADEDAPASEPEAAKVIVVTEATGRQRRYHGDEWQAEEAIDIVRKGDVVATYPPGQWSRACFEGTELDAIQPKAIRLQSALRQVAMADADTPPEILQRIARAELERSGWDEEDL